MWSLWSPIKPHCLKKSWIVGFVCVGFVLGFFLSFFFFKHNMPWTMKQGARFYFSNSEDF